MQESTPENASSEPPQPTSPAETRPLEPEPRSAADEALRVAIVAALDAGDFARVKALVAVLEASPKPAPVLTLATRKPSR